MIYTQVSYPVVLRAGAAWCVTWVSHRAGGRVWSVWWDGEARDVTGGQVTASYFRLVSDELDLAACPTVVPLAGGVMLERPVGLFVMTVSTVLGSPR